MMEKILGPIPPHMIHRARLGGLGSGPFLPSSERPGKAAVQTFLPGQLRIPHLALLLGSWLLLSFPLKT